MNFRKLLTVLAAATVALSGVAYANPILRLQSGATTITISPFGGGSGAKLKAAWVAVLA